MRRDDRRTVGGGLGAAGTLEEFIPALGTEGSVTVPELQSEAGGVRVLPEQQAVAGLRFGTVPANTR